MTAPRCSAFYGHTNPSLEERESAPVKRYASVIGLRPEKEAYYRGLHAEVWPTVLDALRRANIRNYSIYVTQIDGKRYLFSYFEYVGDDFDADMARVAADPETQRWWQETDPCQIPLPDRDSGARWQDMEMVFLMA